MRRPKLIGVNRDKRLTVCVRESPPKRSEWGIVPEGVLPERDRGLALRAVALGRAWTLLGSRKNSKPREAKCLMRSVPHAAKRQSLASNARFVGRCYFAERILVTIFVVLK
jgi:hypothetical protein